MLKYLFRCQFNDGEIFYQNLEDTSTLEEGKSSFFDLLEKEKQSPIKEFYLYEKDINYYSVNLKNGSFTINGISFFIHEQTTDLSKKLSNFRLIYFRRVTQSLNITTGEALAPTTVYIIGWQANYPDGKNEQKLLYII